MSDEGGNDNGRALWHAKRTKDLRQYPSLFERYGDLPPKRERDYEAPPLPSRSDAPKGRGHADTSDSTRAEAAPRGGA